MKLLYFLALLLACFFSGCATEPQGNANSSVLTGTVRKSDGTPVYGAWVSLMVEPSGSLFYPVADYSLAATKTDKRGAYTLTVNPPKSGKHLFLIVHGREIVTSTQPGQNIVTLTDVKKDNLILDAPNLVEVPNDFVPSAKSPRAGLLSP